MKLWLLMLLVTSSSLHGMIVHNGTLPAQLEQDELLYQTLLQTQQDEINNSLVAAVYKDDSKLMKEILYQGASVSLLRGEHDQTILHIAVVHNALACLKELLREIFFNATDARQTDSRGYTALHYAAELNHFKCVEELLKTHHFLEGSTLSEKSAINKKTTDLGRTPLHLATSPEVITLLIKFGADCHAEDTRGHTPLLLAVAQRKANLVRALRSYPVVWSRTFSYQFQRPEVIKAFELAVRNHDKDCVKALLEPTADGIYHDQIEEQHSIVRCITSIVKELSTSPITATTSSESEQSRNNDTKSMIEFLNDLQESVKKQVANDSALLSATEKNDSALVQSLLQSGAHCEVYGERRLSPVLTALSYGNFECLKLLLDWGTNILHKPMYIAWQTLVQVGALEWFDIAQLLAEYGAQIDPKMSSPIFKKKDDKNLDQAKERKFLVALLRASIIRYKPQKEEVLEALKRVWAVIYSLGIENSLPPYVILELLQREEGMRANLVTIFHYYLCKPQEDFYTILRDELKRSSLCRAKLLREKRKKFEDYIAVIVSNTKEDLSAHLLKKFRESFGKNIMNDKPVLLENVEKEFGPELIKYIIERMKECQ